MSKKAKKAPFVTERLRKAADIFEQRAAVYGDNYLHFGTVMSGLFPRGLHLTTTEEFARLGVFIQIASKLTRYAQNMNKGGHEDSLDDMSVYSMMLQEIDAMWKDINSLYQKGKR